MNDVLRNSKYKVCGVCGAEFLSRGKNDCVNCRRGTNRSAKQNAKNAAPVKCTICGRTVRMIGPRMAQDGLCSVHYLRFVCAYVANNTAIGVAEDGTQFRRVSGYWHELTEGMGCDGQAHDT